jgi:hypothetical protein
VLSSQPSHLSLTSLGLSTESPPRALVPRAPSPSSGARSVALLAR